MIFTQMSLLLDTVFTEFLSQDTSCLCKSQQSIWLFSLYLLEGCKTITLILAESFGTVTCTIPLPHFRQTVKQLAVFEFSVFVQFGGGCNLNTVTSLMT